MVVWTILVPFWSSTLFDSTAATPYLLRLHICCASRCGISGDSRPESCDSILCRQGGEGEGEREGWGLWSERGKRGSGEGWGEEQELPKV